jgi:hypothetical protein
MIENIYYMTFSVIPTIQNQEYNNVNSVTVSCWIKSTDSNSYYITASFYIEKFDWEIEKNIQKPIIVYEENFYGKDLGLENFHKAEKEKMAFVYVAVAKDAKTETIKTLKSSYKFNMSKFILEKEKLYNQGRCLHYQADNRCNEIIKAHSVQKKGLLSKISRNNKVYCLSQNMGDFKKNEGEVVFKEEYITKFSIFRGFCKKHDNKLFEPIDNSFFSTENMLHILLYSYRSLSREFFNKENSLNLYKKMLEDAKENLGLNKYFTSYLYGTAIGYKSLEFHKNIYDNLLRNELYDEMRYVSFNSSNKLNVVFSNVLYPEYDFKGNLLQNLSDTSKPLDLISFYSAPTETGWSFIFSWHKSSNYSCYYFIQSLQTMIKEGASLSDLLFQFAIFNGENIAFCPDYWESLSNESQSKITKGITNMINPTRVIRENYLKNSLQNIIDWNFETVNDNLSLDS